jgi:hypothetical protein
MIRTTRLDSVHAGDILTLQRSCMRVLSSQRDADLVTLELEDTPDHPMTFIGAASLTVTIEPGQETQTQAGQPMSAGEAPVEKDSRT